MRFWRRLSAIGGLSLAIAIAQVFPFWHAIAVAAKPTLPLAASKQPDLSRRIYQARDDEPDYCNLKDTVGWFVWYYDVSGQCTIIIVANEQEAARRSWELFEYSFSVMTVGYGFKENMTF
jgi:hypothetical protein